MTGRPPATPARPVQLHRLPLPVLLGAMLLAGLCTLLALNTASAAQELKQQALTGSNAATSDIEQQLVRDLAAQRAPAALAAAAQRQGLVPNPNPAFLRINADGSVTVLGSPTPASAPPAPVTPTPSKTPTATASKSPTGSTKPSPTASTKPSAVVTVTVTRPAPPATSPTPRPRPTPTSTPTATATGGH